MRPTLRIGSAILPHDPFWVQVSEAISEYAERLHVELFPVYVPAYGEIPGPVEQEAILEELVASDLQALIVWALPENLLLQIPERGIPLILLGETDARHPLLCSGEGMYDMARLAMSYLYQKLDGPKHIVAVGGLGVSGWQDNGAHRLAGVRDFAAACPGLQVDHIPTRWNYDAAVAAVEARLPAICRPFEAVIGMSDAVALAARDAGRRLNCLAADTIVVGIGGTPAGLTAMSQHSMGATVDIRTDRLGRIGLKLAIQAATGTPLPAHFRYQFGLVTAENLAEVAAQKLTEISSLPDRLVGQRRREQAERVKQLETSLAMGRKVGGTLDAERLSSEILDAIRTNYGYDRIRIFRWLEEPGVLVLEGLAGSAPERPFSLDPLGALGRAVFDGEPVFIPDTQRSTRFAPDPESPDTRTRVALPIRVSGKLWGVLDLHSNQLMLRTHQDLIGLQLLADQIGVAVENSHLYTTALEARAAAEKADLLKSRLLANVSHELRTPLSVILGHVQTLLQPENAPALTHAGRADLVHIQRHAEHLRRIIGDLLDLSRAEVGELELYPEVMDVRQFMTEVFSAFSEGKGRDDLEWRLELPESLPLLRADPLRLRQVLLNLLSNAGKFTERGHISLGAEVAPPHLHVWVADTGTGISDDMQDEVFQPFVTSGQRARGEGIGLGLSITRQLVTLHGGNMRLESQVGHGSIFHIYLPLPSLVGERLGHFDVEGGPVLAWLSSQAVPSPRLQALALAQGLQVRRLRPGDNVSSFLAEHRPAAIGWDAGDASPAGWALIQRLSCHPLASQLPFIAYADSAGQVDAPGPAEAGQRVGDTGFVMKPAAPATLVEALRALTADAPSAPIYVVDDDHQARALHRAAVERALPGHEVVEAGDGAAAWALVLERAPGLVLLDLAMPEMDGFDFLDRLRADPRFRTVPVIIMSGRALTVENLRRLERHSRVVFEDKEVLSEAELGTLLQDVLRNDERPGTHTSRIVKQAVQFLHENYSRPLSRGDIAAEVGVNEAYLGNIFRREVGISLWDYLRRYRINCARRLLTRDPAGRLDHRTGRGLRRPRLLQPGLPPGNGSVTARVPGAYPGRHIAILQLSLSILLSASSAIRLTIASTTPGPPVCLPGSGTPSIESRTTNGGGSLMKARTYLLMALVITALLLQACATPSAPAPAAPRRPRRPPPKQLKHRRPPKHPSPPRRRNRSRRRT